MLSKSTGYAIQMLVWLAKKYQKGNNNDSLFFVHHIAEEIGVPQNFLSKIAVTLSKKELILAQKGPKGGVCLAIPPEKITVYDVVQIFDEDIIKDKCLIGKAKCSDFSDCPLHEFWKEEKKKVLQEFKKTTIKDLVSD